LGYGSEEIRSGNISRKILRQFGEKRNAFLGVQQSVGYFVSQTAYFVVIVGSNSAKFHSRSEER
jgi:hypothetical protein